MALQTYRFQEAPTEQDESVVRVVPSADTSGFGSPHICDVIADDASDAADLEELMNARGYGMIETNPAGAIEQAARDALDVYSTSEVDALIIGAGFQFLNISGQSLTGAEDDSVLDISTTWNTTGTPTAIKLNVTDTASNAASLLVDLQIGGTSKFKIEKDGDIIVPAGTFVRIGSTAVVEFSSFGLFGPGGSGTNGQLLGNGFISLGSGAALQWSSDFPWRNIDLELLRDGVGILAQRDSTNAQESRIYNTWTNSTNYERGALSWKDAANILSLQTEAGGTGTLRGLNIQDAVGLLGFFDTTPIIQPAAANQADQGVMTTVGANTGTAGAGLSLMGDTTSVDQAANIMNDFRAVQEDVSALDALLTETRTALVALGLMKGAA